MKKLLNLLFVTLFASIVGFVAAACSNTDQNANAPYFGTYHGGITRTTATITVEKDYVIEDGEKYHYTVTDGGLLLDNGAHIYFFNDYDVLVLGEFIYKPTYGMIPVRNGYFDATIMRLDSNLNPIESFTFNSYGEYTYYDANNVYGMSQGYYTMKNGILYLQGFYNAGNQLFRTYIYVTQSGEIYLGAFIRIYITPPVGGNRPSESHESEESSQTEYVTLTYAYGEETSEMTVEKNAKIKLPSPIKEGYTFKGWNVNGIIKQGNEIISVSSDITLYATWEIDKYTITYNLNGGKLKNAITEFTINDLPLTLQFPDGETDNMSFVKWTTDEEGNNEITEILKETACLKDYSVYAFYENSSNCLTYKYNSEIAGYEVRSYTGNAKSVTIPSEYKGVTVKSIGDYAFYDCSSLTSIIIPDGVISIGRGAFADCRRLTEIKIPNSVISVRNCAFMGCSNLKFVTIGGNVLSIGHQAFDGCYNLERVDYNGSIEDWCKISFSYNQSNPLCHAHNLYINNELITEVVIPNTVEAIKFYSFHGCSLTKIIIPDDITSIDSGAFYDCTHLSTIVIGKNLAGISEQFSMEALHGCEVKTIYINSQYMANDTSSDLYDYAETVYVGKDINLTSSYYGVVMEKESEETVTVDGVEYYKYVLKK